ncbi:Ni/Fe-hydrogenase, b-type cytochrome subunit [Desulfitobacterium dichloroeliminans LMG P-21439]|uniref:Ni/Fe-hydrogenase, b-type cytochrome subunit n=1 Tax=Desulfitobacterium dichloroeliminans (strain LMG P-21439 / DCA1) TaxID=871963 RepID=L0F8F6_DESDL|nr:Ni/Fe-hydrogenase, b-type cytochrome subunit [Desulfitobacterium dichloroeliminans]AGA69320.1 Ni/Fe-hydrogenase, b-type cytochrome subunit [Desulfitobacterium dichloroeliminans LMG P-21439]
MANPAEHPLSHRITHWINLINFIALIFTGLLIHSPYEGMPMNAIRNIHFFFMYSLIFTGIIRFYISFLSKDRDYKKFFINAHDVKGFVPQIKYYLFLQKNHPDNPNAYNPMQKLAYIGLPILAVLQIVTGALLYLPMKFASLEASLGGLAAIRGFHFVVTWLFIAIIAVHVYMVFTEAIDQFWYMFFGIDRKKNKSTATGKTSPLEH